MAQEAQQGRISGFFRSRGGVNYGLCSVAVALFVLVWAAPVPASLLELVGKPHPAGYRLQPGTSSIAESVSQILGEELSPEEVAQKAKIMVAVLFTAAFLWGTEAIPLGATDLLVGSVLYLFFILPLDSISKAYMKDAVFFIFGVLAIAVGASKTGLDRRIGVLLLGRIKTLKGFCFVFLPLLAVAAGFLSEHALTAILVPIVLRVYRSLCDHHGVKTDRALAVFLVLGIVFALNQGGPGSPAAGGRNAVMVAYLQDFGKPISFLQWMLLGLPFVLLVAPAIGLYMYLTFRRKLKVKTLNLAEFVRKEADQLGKMSRQETSMAFILGAVVLLWITASVRFGLGGPCMFGVVLMLVLRIITWKDIQTHVRFDVVGLYAAACAIGVGLKLTGASIWLAQSLVDSLPGALRHGDALIIAISLFTGTLTNFMSDGATVAAVGPVALSMAALADIHLWKVGLVCAFSSSFANVMIVGTPNNAIAYVGGVDPKSGERLIKLRDFLIHGIPVTLLAWAVLWGLTVFGYWQWVAWP